MPQDFTWKGSESPGGESVLHLLRVFGARALCAERSTGRLGDAVTGSDFNSLFLRMRLS